MALSVMWCLSSIAQQFTDVSNQMQLYVPIGNALLGAGMSTYDIDSNGFEDLTFATNGNGVFIYLNFNGEFSSPIILEDNEDAKAVIWADYDNDGDADLLVTHDGANNTLYNNNGNQIFFDVTESAGLLSEGIGRSHGAAWSDVNKDGFLDLYICNYDWGEGAPNWLFMNQGDGSFIESAQAMSIDNGILPSFMPSFSDFNKDGNPDLYIINDKTALNALYVSDDENTFSDLSAFSGTNILADAMSNSITDFDRDGDMDIYVSNNYLGNKLLRNDGDNQFTEIASEMNIDLNIFSWGALWIDINNSGFPDLFISTETPLNVNANPIFENNNGDSFTSLNTFSPSNTSPSFSNSFLDFNGDGALDIAQSNDGTNGIYLWENNADVGSWVRIKLEGTISNKNGVGSWIEVYTNNQILAEFTKCGEGYMSQRSQFQHFGLGEETAIDSVIVKWPSGIIDTFYELPILETHHLIEGASLELSLNPTETLWLCNNDSIQLDAGNYASYQWSNGATSSSIWVSEPSNISVEVTTIEGYTFSSPTYFVEMAPEIVYESTVTNPSCFDMNDGEIEIISDQIDVINWNNELTGTSLENLAAAVYEMNATDIYGCITTSTFILVDPPMLHLYLSPQHVLCHGENTGHIEITNYGGTGQHEIDGVFENLSQGDYTITITDELGCIASETTTISSPDPLEVEFSVTHVAGQELGEIQTSVIGGTPPYEFFWSNTATEQNLSNLSPGSYQCNIVDANGCQFTEVITVEQIVGILERTNKVLLFPNPTTGVFSIEGLSSNNVQINVFSSLGERVYQATLSQGNIDLSHLPSGYYHIIIQDGDRNLSYQLIIR